MIFDHVGRHFGAPRVTFSDSVLKRGSNGGGQSQKDRNRDPFPVRSGSQEGHFWVHFGSNISKLSFFKRCLVTFFRTLKKQSKWSSPRGGRCAIRQCLRMFRKGRPLSLWLHFGLHLESFWGPSSLLYSFLVAQVAKTGSQKRGTQNKINKYENRPHGSCG